MEEMLKAFLPKLLGEEIPRRYIVFEGKQDLEKRLIKILRGYKAPDARFIVLRDKDSGDCRKAKIKLKQLCAAAGKADAIVRIACHELESWYLGDLAAVERAFPHRKVARHQVKSKFKTPDRLANAGQELSRLIPEYQNISGSRAIGPHLSVEGNRSQSFNVFVNSMRGLAR